jgi:hypothetical protein
MSILRASEVKRLAIHRKKPGVIDQIRAGRLKARGDGLLIERSFLELSSISLV